MKRHDLEPAERAPRPSRRPVAMVSHSYYEEDPRVRREAEGLPCRGPCCRRPWTEPIEVYAIVDNLDALGRQPALEISSLDELANSGA